jgi:hypothetical protein
MKQPKPRTTFVTCCSILGLAAAFGAHARLGHRHVIVENCRGESLQTMTVGVAGSHDTRYVRAGAVTHDSFPNPWPMDGAVDLSIRRVDGSMENHQCLYLGHVPQVVFVRVLPNDVVECERIGPSLLAFFAAGS